MCIFPLEDTILVGALHEPVKDHSCENHTCTFFGRDITGCDIQICKGLWHAHVMRSNLIPNACTPLQSRLHICLECNHASAVIHLLQTKKILEAYMRPLVATWGHICGHNASESQLLFKVLRLSAYAFDQQN